MQRFFFTALAFFYLCSNVLTQDFRWGLKGGLGYSFYGLPKTEFSDPKGNPYTFEGTSGVTSIIIGASGFIKIKKSQFYFAPGLYYIRGGGMIEFNDLSENLPDGEKTVITQKDQVFELAALLGFEFSPARIFLGPSFSYRITTDGTASNYLDDVFPNTIGETNTQSLYVNLQFGVGLMISKNSTINLRYSFPLLGDEFTVENNTFVNNASFSIISVDYSFLFDSNK